MVTMYGKLAKAAAEQYLKTRTIMQLPTILPRELMQQRACYVSLLEKPGRRVRVMYGNVLPRQPSLASEIVANTLAALQSDAMRNTGRADVPHVSYSVAVLGPLQRISATEHLDPQRLGLYVRSDRDKTALLLPQRTGIETAEDQVATALRESGINLQSEAVTMYRFTVEYYDA